MNNQFSSLLTNPPYNPDYDGVLRFSGAEWFKVVREQNVMIAGLGGIGSWLALIMSRFQPHSLALVDDDTVSAVNRAGQFFCGADVGSSKVQAVCTHIQDFSGFYLVNTYCERLTETSQVNRVLLCGFDNMAARKLTYRKWKDRATHALAEHDRCLFIDGRLSAETLQIFCITEDAPYYMEQYERDWLFSDNEAEGDVCSYKQTSYCANLIASLMANLFVNWCTNQCNPLIDRALPFMLEYSAEQMFLKTVV